MNTQDILRKGVTRFDLVLDYSELYDFELVDVVLGKLDIVLDSSEFYDYTLGDYTMDYMLVEIFVTETNGTFLLTHDGYILTSHDNYMISYH